MDVQMIKFHSRNSCEHVISHFLDLAIFAYQPIPIYVLQVHLQSREALKSCFHSNKFFGRGHIFNKHISYMNVICRSLDTKFTSRVITYKTALSRALPSFQDRVHFFPLEFLCPSICILPQLMTGNQLAHPTIVEFISFL